MIAKGTKWIMNLQRLAKPMQGISFHNMQHLYNSITIPKMFYAADIWFSPIHDGTHNKKALGLVGFADRLIKVQWIATLHITGAMRTTATDLLDTHADLLPIRLALDRHSHNAALRLLSLPDNHPLHPYIHRATCPIKRYKSLLHRLLQAHNLKSGELETIHPNHLHPAWAPPFHTSILQNEEEAIAFDKANVSLIKIYSDGSSTKGGIGVATIFYINGLQSQALHHHLGAKEHHTIYKAEIVGLILVATLLQHMNFLEEVTIATYNQVVIKAITNYRSTPRQ